MNCRKLLITLAMTGITAASFAQAKPGKPKSEPQPPKAAKDMTPQERKKAAVKRTLKEKNFHLPDTAHATRNR